MGAINKLQTIDYRLMTTPVGNYTVLEGNRIITRMGMDAKTIPSTIQSVLVGKIQIQKEIPFVEQMRKLQF